LKWGFGAGGWSQGGFKATEVVPFGGGLSGVETVRGIGWSVAYCWGVEATNAHS
jgi:hypothetical protein